MPKSPAATVAEAPGPSAVLECLQFQASKCDSVILHHKVCSCQQSHFKLRSLYCVMSLADIPGAVAVVETELERVVCVCGGRGALLGAETSVPR